MGGGGLADLRVGFNFFGGVTPYAWIYLKACYGFRTFHSINYCPLKQLQKKAPPYLRVLLTLGSEIGQEGGLGGLHSVNLTGQALRSTDAMAVG